MLKNYFSLTKNERNGFFVCVLIIIVLMVYIAFSSRQASLYEVDLSTLSDSVQSFYAKEKPIIKKSYKQQLTSSPLKTNKSYVSKVKDPKPFIKKKNLVVNINSATRDQLLLIHGVGDYYADEILEYRLKIGGFSDKEQLKDIYGLTDENYDRIVGQIYLDTTLVLPKIDINTIDSLGLSAIDGLSCNKIKSILGYRDRLGGYYKIEQLREVYGLSLSEYKIMTYRVNINDKQLHYLDINNAAFKDVMRHPYIDGYDNTKAIFRYLDYGIILSWDEFIKIPGLQGECLDQLKYYLVFNPKIEE